MKGKNLTLLIAVVITLSLFTIGCTEEPDYALELSGGIVLDESDDHIRIRSISPDTEIVVQGFQGTIEVTNSHLDSVVEGVDQYERDTTSIKIDIPDKTERTITIDTPEKAEFEFAVIGDTQGMNHIFQDAVDDMEDIEFLLHTGDLTPHSRQDEYYAVMEVIDNAGFPVYTTIGNHDNRFDGTEIYEEMIAPTEYSFVYSDHNFIFLDTSELSLTEDQIDWIDTQVLEDKQNVIVTHSPYFDPFGGDHTLDPDSNEMLEQYLSEGKIDVFMSGHIHAFYEDSTDGMQRLITGGGGGSLVHGVHHYTHVTANSAGLSFEKVPIDTPEQNIYEIIVERDGEKEFITYERLLQIMKQEGVSGTSSFQNQFDNQRGEAYYSGVKISTIIEKVGGMDEDDILVIESIDGHTQEFGYLNVYPDDYFLSEQGEFILALTYDNQTIDEWSDGPRAVFMPEDGYYTNKNCENTSYEGQGWYEYESAGARWVKYVKYITVVEGG